MNKKIDMLKVHFGQFKIHLILNKNFKAKINKKI
jgi:hypothetical protein